MDFLRLWRKVRFEFSTPKQRIKLYRKAGMKIGTNCEINKSAIFISEPYLISIGNNVRITAGVKFITHDGGVFVLRNKYKNNKNYKDIEKADLLGRIIVGNNVHIGVDAIIMPNVKIGDNCIIGCGAVVTKDIPENSIAVGVPARVIKTIDEYFDQNMDDFLYIKNMSYDQKRAYLEKSKEMTY